MRFPRCLVTLFIIVGIAGIPGFALGTEESPHPWVGGLEPLDTTDMTPVNIDVFVRDHDGQPVIGLEKEQFRVLQDGEEMSLTRFTAHTDRSSEADFDAPPPLPPVPNSPATLPDEDIDPIYVVLYIDNANLREEDRNQVLGPLRRFAGAILQGGEARIMVVTRGNTLETVQPFTADPREVTRALRYVRTTETFLEDVDTEHLGIQRNIRRAVNDRTRTNTGRQQVLSNIYGEIRSFAHQEEFRLADTLQGIYEIGAMLTGINGRKYLVYLSNGMPLVLVKDLFHEFSALDPRMASASLATPYNKRRGYQRLASAANALQITIYTIDATGTYSSTGSMGSSNSAQSTSAATVKHQNETAPLVILAEATGGLPIVNTEDFDIGLDRLKADLLTYYSLGYDIPTTGSDTVHSIEISVDTPKSHELRYRRAFIEKSIESKVQQKTNAGLFFEVDDNPMDLEVTSGGQEQATPDRWIKPLKISFPKRNLAMVPEGEEYVGTAQIFIATRDIEGRSTDILRRTKELRLPIDNYEQRLNERFYIDINLLLPAGRHHIVVGVLDPLTNRASYQKIQVFVNTHDLDSN